MVFFLPKNLHVRTTILIDSKVCVAVQYALSVILISGYITFLRYTGRFTHNYRQPDNLFINLQPILDDKQMTDFEATAKASDLCTHPDEFEYRYTDQLSQYRYTNLTCAFFCDGTGKCPNTRKLVQLEASAIFIKTLGVERDGGKDHEEEDHHDHGNNRYKSQIFPVAEVVRFELDFRIRAQKYSSFGVAYRGPRRYLRAKAVDVPVVLLDKDGHVRKTWQPGTSIEMTPTDLLSGEEMPLSFRDGLSKYPPNTRGRAAAPIALFTGMEIIMYVKCSSQNPPKEATLTENGLWCSVAPVNIRQKQVVVHGFTIVENELVTIEYSGLRINCVASLIFTQLDARETLDVVAMLLLLVYFSKILVRFLVLNRLGFLSKFVKRFVKETTEPQENFMTTSVTALAACSHFDELSDEPDQGSPPKISRLRLLHRLKAIFRSRREIFTDAQIDKLAVRILLGGKCSWSPTLLPKTETSTLTLTQPGFAGFFCGEQNVKLLQDTMMTFRRPSRLEWLCFNRCLEEVIYHDRRFAIVQNHNAMNSNTKYEKKTILSSKEMHVGFSKKFQNLKVLSRMDNDHFESSFQALKSAFAEAGMHLERRCAGIELLLAPLRKQASNSEESDRPSVADIPLGTEQQNEMSEAYLKEIEATKAAAAIASGRAALVAAAAQVGLNRATAKVKELHYRCNTTSKRVKRVFYGSANAGAEEFAETNSAL
eukprot:TRINITY_DN63041_c0_g1_i1.p1 TRINITY_DN63041_c0_g1~~TRINITY_DN63041_c0_g1_i1.p1  ORF type:complete len:728 (-),score=71.27 TRINITY_DN63041_c0_g1_i1:152-2278(-)